MRGSLMGAGAVGACCRYLGTFVACRSAQGGAHGDMQWDADMERLVVQRTWLRHIGKIGDRVGVMTSRPGSPGHRAATWNTYMASCIPFPSQLCLPGVYERRVLDRKLVDALGLHGWCPAYAIAGLTLAWGISGGPRHPGCVAEAAAIIAWLRGGGWGSRGLRELQRRAWSRLRDWAEFRLGLLDHGHASIGRDVASIAALVRPDFGAGIREQVRGKRKRHLQAVLASRSW